MAVTKIWKVTRSFSDPIDYVKNPEKTRNPAAEKSRQMLEDVIEYAANEDKTEQKFFVTGINCDRDHARDEFLMTKRRFAKEDGCFLQAIIPKSCIQKWRKLHLHFGENCRLPGRVAKALHRQHCRHITDSVIAL